MTSITNAKTCVCAKRRPGHRDASPPKVRNALAVGRQMWTLEKSSRIEGVHIFAPNGRIAVDDVGGDLNDTAFLERVVSSRHGDDGVFESDAVGRHA